MCVDLSIMTWYLFRSLCSMPMYPLMTYFSKRSLMYLQLATQIWRSGWDMFRIFFLVMWSNSFLQTWNLLSHLNLQIFYTVDNPTNDWTGGKGYISKDMAVKGLPGPGDDALVLVSSDNSVYSQPSSWMNPLKMVSYQIFLQNIANLATNFYESIYEL